jgi:hypothetical protein
MNTSGQGFDGSPKERDDVEAAIDTVARQVIARLVDWHVGDSWEDFPEIVEGDWQRVQARCLELTPEPDAYQAAYALLESRAEHTC